MTIRIGSWAQRAARPRSATRGRAGSRRRADRPSPAPGASRSRGRGRCRRARASAPGRRGRSARRCAAGPCAECRGPMSATSMRTRPSGAGRTCTATRPPAGVYLIALSSRFASICSTALRSAISAVRAVDLDVALEFARAQARVEFAQQPLRPARRRRSARAAAARSPLSMRESSSRSSTSAPRRFALPTITSTACLAFASGSSASASRLGEAADRGERRLQLVRGVGDEVAAHRLDAPHLGHVVKHGDRARRARRATGTAPR